MENKQNPFSENAIIDICNSITDTHRILRTVGEFLTEIDSTTENTMIADFKKWGVRTITDEMLAKQLRKIEQLRAIYEAEQKKL